MHAFKISGSLSWRPSWCTEQVPGQPRVHGEICVKKKEEEYQEEKEDDDKNRGFHDAFCHRAYETILANQI